VESLSLGKDKLEEDMDWEAGSSRRTVDGGEGGRIGSSVAGTTGGKPSSSLTLAGALAMISSSTSSFTGATDWVSTAVTVLG